MVAGRPPKPIERKMLLAKGDNRTPGNRKIESPPAGTELVLRKQGDPIPVPPDDLEERGLQEWNNIWTVGNWLHDTEDYHWVLAIAHAYDDIAHFRKRIKRDGLIVKGYAGQVVANPLISEVRKAEAIIFKALSTIGFSPTDRAKLGLQEAKARTAIQKHQDAMRAQQNR